MTQNQNAVAQVPQQPISIVDLTLQRIQQLESTKSLKIPENYSAENAIRAAALMLADAKNKSDVPVLQACTKDSICNALLKMVVQGLNPLKKQCSFIPYGNILTCQREYQGSIALAKRYGMKSVTANAIFSGDEFAFEVDTETGRKKVTKHISDFDSYGGEVKGAYAIIEMEDGTKNVEIMNMRQIQQAWNQGLTKGQSSAHKNFPDQMACKTVINRATKTIINSSDDADLFEDDPITTTETPITAAVKVEIQQQANAGESIGFDDQINTTNTVQILNSENVVPQEQFQTAEAQQVNQQPANNASQQQFPY